MRFKVCLQCRDFFCIFCNSPDNQKNIKIFEEIHQGHTLVIMDKKDLRKTNPNKIQETILV